MFYSILWPKYKALGFWGIRDLGKTLMIGAKTKFYRFITLCLSLYSCVSWRISQVVLICFFLCIHVCHDWCLKLFWSVSISVFMCVMIDVSSCPYLFLKNPCSRRSTRCYSMLSSGLLDALFDANWCSARCYLTLCSMLLDDLPDAIRCSARCYQMPCSMLFDALLDATRCSAR